MSWPALLVVTAAVAVTAVSGYLLSTWPPQPPAPSVVAKPAAVTSSTSPSDVSGEHDVLVVLGDSVSAKSDASVGPEWPQLVGQGLGIEVATEAVDGSGYLNPGAGQPFGARVSAVLEHDPDVIVVAGGMGDLGAFPLPRVVREADDLVSRLVREAPDSQVVLISPFSNGEPGPLTKQLSSKLRRVADEQGIAYVDATRWLASSYNIFGEDGVHPTDDGQERIAEQMQQELDGLK